MTLRGAAKGMVAGVVGVAVMTLGEKAEQRVTGRADSYVPSRTLAHLLRLRRPEAKRPVRNHAMHWGTGIVLGAVRGLMAERGLRGPKGSAVHTVVRLSTDQALENATGVGSPPWTWSRRDLVVDVGHKAVYGIVTGWVADRLVGRTPAATIDGASAGAVDRPTVAGGDRPAAGIDGGVTSMDEAGPSVSGGAGSGGAERRTADQRGA